MIRGDHFTQFPPEWWTERRRRDYFIGADNLVRLRPDSETAKKLDARLVTIAKGLAPK